MAMKPKVILLFSGKRKSGKDYITDLLLNEINDKDAVKIIKISAPIKSYFAKTFNLNLNELLGTGEYKEKFRSDMIKWSESMRGKDAGVFCREAIALYNATDVPIWIVSDVRRKTDIEWFQTNFPDFVKTVRIEANEETRRSRGWTFTTGVDDISSECDLDDYEKWDLKIDNNDLNIDDKDLLKDIMGLLKISQ